MKRVLLVFLAVLLAVTFILAVYFYAENRELQSQGKVRVFSLKKWLQDFSEVEFPEYDLESWYSDRYGFTVGETFTYSDLYDRIESMVDRTIWDKLFMYYEYSYCRNRICRTRQWNVFCRDGRPCNLC